MFSLLVCYWDNFAFIFTGRIALQLSLLVMSLSTSFLSDTGLTKCCMLSTKSKQTIYTQTNSHSVSWWNASELCLGSTCNLLILQLIETPSRGPAAAYAWEELLLRVNSAHSGDICQHWCPGPGAGSDFPGSLPWAQLCPSPDGRYHSYASVEHFPHRYQTCHASRCFCIPVSGDKHPLSTKTKIKAWS